MRFTQSWLAVGAIIVSMTLPNGSWAASESESRLTRLENIVENELNIGLFNQLEALQQELRELRGKLEEQQNALQAANQKQDKLFINLDTRLNNLNTQQPATAVTQEVIPPPSPTAVLMPTAAAKPVTEDPISSEQIAKFNGTSEKSLYDAAYMQMSNKKYAEAITEFKDLLWQFPEGTFTSSAYYWLGEIYLLQWYQNRKDLNLLEQSKDAFATVANKYQGQPKEVDALLKLGMIEIDLGNWEQAKSFLTQVVQKQPNSSRARIAESKLQRMQQQSNF